MSTLCRVRVNQFYGLEIDDAAAHIARVALWITDHQMNLESADRFGNTRPTVPLVDTPHIHKENALRVDWTSVLAPEQCSYLQPPTLASNKLRLMPDATLYHFAVLNSTMHMAWTRAVCGRLESRYQYSVTIVYNNFPWPSPSDAQLEALEAAGQAILDAQAMYLGQGSSLADLYDPRTMPSELRKAHAANDRAVDAAYKFKGDKSDAVRVAFLFSLYGRLTSLLPSEKPKRARKEKAVA